MICARAPFLPLCLALLQLLVLVPAAAAQSALRPADKLLDDLLKGQSRLDANAGTVSIMTERALDGPVMRAVLDLSVLLDDGEHFEKMRILPIVARGKMQNLWDIMYLHGVDMGFLQTDLLGIVKDDPQVGVLKDRLRYIAVMFPEEVTVIARGDIATLQDLAGKTVSVDAKGTSTNITAPLVLRRLGIEARYEAMDTAVAMEHLLSGDLAAHVMVQARPARTVQRLKGKGLHILPIPYTEAFLDLYLPSRFTSEDYPNLIPPGEQVETIAVNQVLAAVNVPEYGERYRKIARFVDAFFSRFDELLKPGFLPQWKDVNIAAEVGGWTRFKAAQDWLDRRAKQEAQVKQDLRDTFTSYLKKSGRPNGTAEKEKLFEEFLKWKQGR